MWFTCFTYIHSYFSLHDQITKTSLSTLKTLEIGYQLLEKALDLVDVVITVEDKEIVEATRYCYKILKVVIEPGAAIALAAILSDNFKKIPISSCSQNIGIVLSWGNADLGVLFESWKN
ncbi:putative ammonia-lyase, Serine racemase [Helianthus annuus]|nr:putative ammonia-lyase, Serine racemase [Helianthus annuus]